MSMAFRTIERSKSAFQGDMIQYRVSLAVRESLGKLAAQVAHDIRSPLAALDNVMASVRALPEDDRILVRTAVNRIKDIANNLIDKNREIHSAENRGIDTGVSSKSVAIGASSDEAPVVELLSSLVDPLITEKRMQFRSRLGIDIDGRLDESSYGLFAKIQPTEFKRVLSNLINSGVEVLEDRGIVTVNLARKNDLIEIRVTDNGKGIPPEILAKLGKRGETHGKQGGSGLGLYHARTSVEAWGGSLQIESDVGRGTSVVIHLPEAPAPDWFVSELKLAMKSTVVILDDDSSIHAIWQSRFDSLRVSEKGIDVQHFSTPRELSDWVSKTANLKSTHFLTDYELIGFKETGLSLIESLKLGPQSILITSRFEEKKIREGCERLKVRLIPKGMAGFVPISFQKTLHNSNDLAIEDDHVVNQLVATGEHSVDPVEVKVRYDLCLIDDDIELVHPMWRSIASTKGLKILFFSSAKEFLFSADGIDRQTPIYVDVSLGEGTNGLDLAQEIHKLGFVEISLTTGYEPDSIAAPPFIRRVIGKDFPLIEKPKSLA